MPILKRQSLNHDFLAGNRHSEQSSAAHPCLRFATSESETPKTSPRLGPRLSPKLDRVRAWDSLFQDPAFRNVR